MTLWGEGTVIRPPLPEVPAPLAEYTDRLLLSTGLHAEDAQLIASRHLDPPAELEPLARALCAGWGTEDRQ
jgi:hypothetical protein